MITLDEALDAVMQLQPEKQDILFDIVKKDALKIIERKLHYTEKRL